MNLSFRDAPKAQALESITSIVITDSGFAPFGRDPEWRAILALVSSFPRRDLFDHLDNAAPELGVGDACEGAR
jgi:hypothetical protein